MSGEALNATPKIFQPSQTDSFKIASYHRTNFYWTKNIEKNFSNNEMRWDEKLSLDLSSGVFQLFSLFWFVFFILWEVVWFLFVLFYILVWFGFFFRCCSSKWANSSQQWDTPVISARTYHLHHYLCPE